MTHQQHVEKAHQLATEWFAKHQATLVAQDQNVTIIDWRRPDTGNYAMRFIITGYYVIVTGDVGEAIYGIGQGLTPKQLLSFDWGYFTSKCCASETGRDYTMKVPGIKGPVPNVRAIGHYLGLQMALKQLDAQESTLPTIEQVQATIAGQ